MTTVHGNDYCVYRHTSPSGKVYIGITCQNPLQRWRNGRGYVNCRRFMNAINKYGWDNFKHEILFSGLSEDEAGSIEESLIEQHRSRDERYGYNIREGGSKPHISDETRLLISKANKGRRFSEESRNKMSKAKRGKPSWNKGLKFSEESRMKMSESQRRRARLGIGCRHVNQYDTDGNLIASFVSVKQAAIATGTEKTSISKCLHGVQKTAGGYVWVGGGETNGETI